MILPFLILCFTSIASPARAATLTFSYTGGYQFYSVPMGVGCLNLTLAGGGGAGGNDGVGGAGALVSGQLAVAPGFPYRIIIGRGGVWRATLLRSAWACAMISFGSGFG